MANLTSTVIFSKKALFLLGAIIALLIIIIISSRFIGQFADIFFPPAPIPATVAFGKIPKIDFSEGIKPVGDIHYTVETISGNIENLASSAKVFEISEPIPIFGNLQEAIERAKGAGFRAETSELGGGIIKFVDPQNNSRLLTIETTSQSTTLESQYLNKLEIVTAKLRSTNDAKNTAINFFGSLKLPLKDFPSEKVFLENYKVEMGTLVKSLALADTNLVKVIFTREDIDMLPVISADFNNPPVYALATDKEVVEASYIFGNIQKYKFSTYPLKGTKQAFEDLKMGRGALNIMPTSNVFPIRGVILGYLETKKHQPYLQPVYIFMSDDGFMAYVAAVSDLYTIEN